MKKLYIMNFDCGRMGSLEGLFVAEDTDLNGIIGSEVNFGEALGKHSEVYGTLEDSYITEVSEDQDKIEWLVSVIGSDSISGYNPFDYIEEETCYECGETEEYCGCEEVFQV